MEAVITSLEKELEILSNEIAKLAKFLYSEKAVYSNMPKEKIEELEEEFIDKINYAKALQSSLKIKVYGTDGRICLHKP